jgi:hypothetical protein
MAWLLHPDDYAALVGPLSYVSGLPHVGLGATEIRSDATIERGHIADTDHPELGKPTFAEFSLRYAKVLKDERRAFAKAVVELEKVMRPLDAGTAEVLRRTVGPSGWKPG